ncbi:YsnF/AvaK domain-containing protein [Paracoccus aeridis]|uniref:YsnF/AvaK domain-containing protein n=1 Tax=Paracoccus aeridis TaxID=1966466 RepID=UPI001F39AB97|nr:YsnF/AvaK domain-containing protein [Paracoccus aeridis]
MAMEQNYQAGSARSLSAMFDTRDDADRAVTRLKEAGIADVVLTGEENGGYSVETAPSVSDRDRGFFESIGDFFFPEEDRYAYAEGLNRGGYLVTVSNVPENMYDRALDILDDEGAVDLDARESEWRSQGWTGYTGATGAATGAAAGAATGADYADRGVDRDLTGNEKIDIVEERLNVAKRETDAGRVRVRSYVREIPVEEEVQLRSETVQVERRPVDRPADASAFQERTIEAREYRETPVVHKDARVVEEVDLSKNVESHTETVRDTVRKTEVEIEDERTADRTVDRGITDRDDTFR